MNGLSHAGGSADRPARRVDQFVPELSPGDATTQHTFAVQRALAAIGIGGDVYSERAEPSLAGRWKPESQWTGGPALYQFSVGSAMIDRLVARGGPIAIDYHNLTPVEFAEVWDPPIVHGARWGRQQLHNVAPHVSLALADSHFNASELLCLGYRNVHVAPIIIDPADFAAGARAERVDELRAQPGPRWLFVGRLVPNKAQHHLVLALAAARRRQHDSRLWLIGGASAGRYVDALTATVGALGLGHAVDLAGKVDRTELAARFAAADVLVCTSEHEGFCVPIVEAMHHGLPVVALDAAAVAETAGEAALVLPSAEPTVVASAVERLTTDRSLRHMMIERGHRRARELSAAVTAPHLASLVAQWLDGLERPSR
jgi:L-malate glycosyltransferase